MPIFSASRKTLAFALVSAILGKCARTVAPTFCGGGISTLAVGLAIGEGGFRFRQRQSICDADEVRLQADKAAFMRQEEQPGILHERLAVQGHHVWLQALR